MFDFQLNISVTYVQNITGPIAIIDISHFPAGVYLLHLENDRMVKVEKMIKL